MIYQPLLIIVPITNILAMFCQCEIKHVIMIGKNFVKNILVQWYSIDRLLVAIGSHWHPIPTNLVLVILYSGNSHFSLRFNTLLCYFRSKFLDVAERAGSQSLTVNNCVVLLLF